MTEKNKPATSRALKRRERMKKKKPSFARQESWRYIRLKENWRNPRGLDNKMRRKIKGWPPTAEIGYRGPRITRGLHPSGYREVLVHNLANLEEVDPKTQAIRIAHTVGKRKRAKILVDARKKRIKVLNVKEIKKATKEEELTAEEEKEHEIAEEKEEKPEKEELKEKKEDKKEKPKRKRSKKAEDEGKGEDQ